MANRNELHERQLIWAEYRAGFSNEQAHAKLGPNVSRETIDNFYRRFKAGKISLFDERTFQHRIVQAIQTMPNGDEKDFAESIISVSNYLVYNMATIYGRFAIFSFPSRFDYSTIIFADLFHGEFKEVLITPRAKYGQIFWVKNIGDQHLLIETFNGLFLLKVDYNTWEVILASKLNPDLKYFRDVVVDKLDSRHVVIFNEDAFVTGNLIGDTIVFGPRQNFHFDYFKCTKLAGNELCGLRYMGRNNKDGQIWEYFKIDLATLNEETTTVPFVFNDSFRNKNWMVDNLFQVGKNVYVVFSDTIKQYHVFEFNTETFSWKDTGIVTYEEIRSLFVDKEGVLTMQVDSYGLNTSTFYRFALKKPDSLKTIALLTIRRAALLFNSDLYDRMRPRLLYGYGLRSIFISDFE